MSHAPIRGRRKPCSARRIALLLLAAGSLMGARGTWGYSSYSVRLFGTGGGTQRDRIKVRIDPATPADVGAADFTVELWMRGTLAANVRPTAGYRPDGQVEAANVDWIHGNILVDRDLYGGGPDWGVSVHRDGPADDRGVLRFGTEGSSGGAHTLQGRIHVLDGVWHHIAVVRERATGVKRIYVDGQLDVASAAGASTTDLSYPDGRNTAYPDSDPFLVFGAEKHGDQGTSAYPSFAGWIDEIRIWRVARTQTEIATARTQAPTGTTAGLALYLRLEEGTGQSLADATGGGNGVLYNGTTGQGEWSTEVPPGGTGTTTSTSTSTTSTVQMPVPSTSSTSSSTSTTSTSSTTSSLPPVTTTTTVTASTTTTTTPAGLVAAWGFDEAAGTTTLDASGNGHTGTLVGAGRSAAGRFGRALELSGTGTWVTVADSAALDAGPELTLEAWVRPTILSGYRMILDKTTTGEPTNYYLGLVGGVVEFGFRTSTGWREHRVNGGIGPTVGAWTHVAATYSDAANSVRIYVNGVEVLSRSEFSSLVPNAEQLRLGVGFPDEGFAGHLDEVRIYRRVLTAAEIQADMNQPVSDSTSPTSTTSSTSAVPTSTSSTSSTTSSSSSSSSTSTTTSSTQAPPTTTTSSSTSTSTVATSSTVAAGSTTTTTVPAGLVAAYGFEEGLGTATGDASGAGNTGTLVGAQWTAAGRYGGGIELDGVTQFVAVEASPTLDGGAQLSLEAWVNPTRVDGYRVVLDKTLGGQPSNYYLAVVDGELEFGFYDETDEIWSSHTTNGAGLRTGTWYHLAAVYRDDVNTLTLYVDGTQILSRAETRSLPVNDGELRIGIGFPEEAFAGRIDEVRVYQRALGVAEIRADMANPIVPR